MTDDTVLGKKVEYATTYTPSLLVTLPRSEQRQSLGISEGEMPFHGLDLWNCYDFTWLNGQGKPEVAVAQFEVPCNSKNMIEAKSLKLYLLSFCQTKFGRGRAEVKDTLESDLTVAVQAPVSVNLSAPEHAQHVGLGVLTGQCIDNLDVEIDDYYWNPDYLEISSNLTVKASLYTNLLKSVCPVTGQPDFGSILIQYNGLEIDQEGLLKYIISYREHAEFSEQVVERIFMDILNRCQQPSRLSVYARYARRGGIDINPFRSLDDAYVQDIRLWRQ
mgnify:CR=1 FL=1|jgi:7-cyano-7-deazaguanine reductase|tara:strand:+ start:7152 stop:7976 length:825 start_codon:yes stop_codon:yes gene_type:complete